MPGEKQSEQQPKQTEKESQNESATLEVPKVMRVSVRNGYLVSKEPRNTAMHMLFEHIQRSMNNRQEVDIMRELAGLHGVQIEEVDS